MRVKVDRPPIDPPDPSHPGEIARAHWMTRDPKAKMTKDQDAIMSGARASLELRDSKAWRFTIKGAERVTPDYLSAGDDRPFGHVPTGETVDHSGLCLCVGHEWSRRGPVRVFQPLSGGIHDRFQIVGKLPRGAAIVDRPKEAPAKKRRRKKKADAQ